MTDCLYRKCLKSSVYSVNVIFIFPCWLISAFLLYLSTKISKIALSGNSHTLFLRKKVRTSRTARSRLFIRLLTSKISSYVDGKKSSCFV